MIKSLIIQKDKSLLAKIIFCLSIVRRYLTQALGAHQLDGPSHYCRGHGLEIGASDCPYPFAGASVDYADFFNEDRDWYLQGDGFIALNPPECRLTNVPDSKYDFVYSAHVLEHTANPLSSIQEWVRVLRSGGVIYVVVPNALKTYDFRRHPTSIAVLERRFYNKEWGFTIDDIRTMVTQTEGLPEYEMNRENLENFCSKILSNPDGSHHYFVFDPISMIRLVSLMEKLFGLELINLQVIRHEIHFVMKKAR